MEHLQEIFDILPNGLLLLNPSEDRDNWKCTQVNKAAIEILGIEKTTGLPLDKLLPAEVVEKILDAHTVAVDFFLNDQNRWVLASVTQTETRMKI